MNDLQLTDLSLETIGQLNDGYVGGAIDAAIRAVREDLLKRRKLDKSRAVTLKLNFEPVMDAEGYIGDVDITAAVRPELPPAKLTSRAIMEDDGSLKFKAVCPEDPRQGHLSDAQNAQKESE